MSSPATTTPEPLLRTLSPALRQLEQGLRPWLDAPHRYALSTMQRAKLEGLSNDLRRQAEALDAEQPLLVVMLMGGTGVGKSTLLNALAGGAIAQASFARPTTRDPVVYYHESIRPDRLDHALRHCRLAPHDRIALAHKVIVDTPDLDSNDLTNREKLHQLLPVADIVLYVGSQEKYHDKLGWELFLEQRQRRAFAFVLNKWDRCSLAGAGGLRPDEDLLRDLHQEGFQDPLLFRTCAQCWVDRATGDGALSPPKGEQFPDLARWLELGLDRLEIEAIKARGVGQLLHQLHDALDEACPPDLGEKAGRTRTAWERTLGEEATAAADVLLNTLEPFQREIEHHFALEGQRRFRGLMAGYLQLFTRMKYATSTLRDRIPFLPKAKEEMKAPTAWDLSAFTSACSEAAFSRHLEARGRALANRLLLEADQQGYPLDLLTGPTEAAGKIDWRQRYSGMLVEVLAQVEREWARPEGVRRWVQATILFLSDWLPSVALLAACGRVLWLYIMREPSDPKLELIDWLSPAIVVLVTLVILHVLIALLLPLRWGAIRGEFQRRLRARLQTELLAVYAPVPGDVAEALKTERQQVEQLLNETRQVTTWLEQREQAASITSLYGR